MSENVKETEAAAAVVDETPAAVAVPEGSEVAVESQEPEAQEAAPEAAEDSREAAKYRRKLRDAESERDGLRGQLEAMRRSEVMRLVDAQRVVSMKGPALWAAGVELADLLAEDGTVDAEKVGAAIQATAETLGFPRVPVAPSAHGQGNIGTPIGGGPAPAWQGAFSPRR